MSVKNDKPQTSRSTPADSTADVRVPSAIGVELHPTPNRFDSRTDRRTFLTLMGASAGLAGVGLTGCIRKPVEKIVPFARRPEDLVPGNPLQYATSAFVGGSVMGLLVESQEGRPTKIEGNPRHPMANPFGLGDIGRTDAWTQASILDLYDPDRSREPRYRAKAARWGQAEKGLQIHFADLKQAGGQGLAVLVEATPSPTLWAQLAALNKALPQTRIYLDDPAWPANHYAGLALLGIPRANPVYQLQKARVFLAVDADPLGLEGDRVRNAQQFALGHVQEPGGERTRAFMTRLYVVEPHYTTTGRMADNRLRASGRLCGRFLVALAAQLQQDRLDLGLPTLTPEVATRFTEALARETGRRPAIYQTWLTELSRELRFSREKAALFVGPRQPAWAHALGHLINHRLQNVGGHRPTRLMPADLVAPDGSLEALAGEMKAGRVKTLLMLGGNPVYSAPVDLGFGALLDRVDTSIHLASHLDETSRRATWHLPRTHYLEAWGDLQATDGTVSIQQPLIAPLHGAMSELTLLEWLFGRPRRDHDVVRAHWQARTQGAEFERRWRRWLHDGVTDLARPQPLDAAPKPEALDAALKALSPAAPAAGFELAFMLDPSLYDGRFANNAWLQELPDTVSKLTWDNAAWIDVRTAEQRGIQSGDMIRITRGERSLELPAWVVPGVAHGTLVLPLGYGRKAGGRVARRGLGYATQRLRTRQGWHYSERARISKTGERAYLVTTQMQGSMREPFTGRYRPVARDHTVAEYRSPQFPAIWKQYSLIPEHENRSLWKEPNPRGGRQWGMVIDLARCIGCNTCTLACQAENAIPVVGKDECSNGRELHWIRVDRYFTTRGDGDPMQDPDAGVVVQPLPCQQCETAPCENVCPVGATLHSPEGLNDMAYNRCIGTRYCANNCPFKVRRFNFRNYNEAMVKLVPLISMQRNPDVSERFRGVMEKCSYCVQRIQEAKIRAQADPQQNGVIPVNSVVPACVQACPTGAIVFGDLNQPRSLVGAWRRSARNYSVLNDLNLHPRTTYLAKLRNPNPKLA